jgi:hypothetical protein
MGFGGSTGSSSLSSASDVSLNTVTNSQQLQYNTSTAKWTNGPVATRLVEIVNTVSASGTAYTIPDVTTATVHDITLSGNCTFTFPTASAGKSFTIRITYPATSYSITWPTSVDWPNDTAPALTQAQGKKDLFSFVCITNNSWVGFVAGLNY